MVADLSKKKSHSYSVKWLECYISGGAVKGTMLTVSENGQEFFRLVALNKSILKSVFCRHFPQISDKVFGADHET